MQTTILSQIPTKTMSMKTSPLASDPIKNLFTTGIGLLAQLSGFHQPALNANRISPHRIALPILAALILICGHAKAAIALVDGPSAIDNGSGTSVSSVSSVNVSSTASVLVVLLADTGNGAAPATLTWNSKTLNKVISKTANATTFREAAVYYLFNPGAGTANVTGTLGSSATWWLQSYTLSGVDTSIAALTGGTNSPLSGSAASLAFSLTNVPANAWAAVNCIFASTTATGIAITVTNGAANGTVTTTKWNTSGSTVLMGYASGLSAGTNFFTAATTSTAQKFAFVGAVFTPSTAAPLSAANTVINATPVAVTANGSSTSTITVQAKDINNNNMTSSAGTVTLSTTSGSIGSVTDNGNGTYTATLTSSATPGTATISGTINGGTIGNNASVIFVGPAVAANTVITGTAYVFADGVSTGTITVRAKDANNNNLLISGGTVILSTTTGVLGAVTDNGNGTYTAILTSTNLLGAATNMMTAIITGTIGGNAIGTPASVIFTRFYLADGFNYAAGGSLGTNAPWTAPMTGINVSTNLTYNSPAGSSLLDFDPAGNGAVASSQASGYGTTYVPLVSTVNSGTNFLYCSFLINVQAVPTLSSRVMVGLMSGNQVAYNNGSSTEAFSLICNQNANTWGLQVANGPFPTNFTSALALGQTYMAVIKYDLATGNGYLFINPTPGLPEPEPTLTALTNGVAPSFTNATALGRFFLVSSFTGFSPTFRLDSLRIGATWAEVTPTSIAPPVITVQPASSVLFSGLSAHFGVTASGTAPLGYHWLRNGTNLLDGGGITGSLSNVLSIANASNADALTNYMVIITNAYGAVTSSVASLTLTTTNGAYESATLASAPFAFYTFSETGDVSTGTLPCYDSMGNFNGTYGTFSQIGLAGPQATADGLVGFPNTNTATGPQYNIANSQITLPAFNLNNGLGTNTMTISAWIYPVGPQVNSAAIVFCRAGNTVAGLVYNVLAGDGNYKLGYKWANDAAVTAWDSGLEAPQFQWSLVTLTVTATNATIYVINTNGINSATFVHNHPVQIFDGPTMIGTDGGTSSRNFNGSIDEVALYSQALSSSQLTSLFISAWGNSSFLPVISVQPASASLFSGRTAQFIVNANGSAPLAYHWSRNGANLGNGGNISGSTSNVLTVANVSGADDFTDYTVVITNVYGAVTSTPASFTVITPNAYESAVLANNPFAFYTFGETVDPSTGTTVCFDGLGNFNGTYKAAAQNGYNGIAGPRATADGLVGFPDTNTASAYINPVANSWVTLPAFNLNNGIGTNTMTISAWVYPVGPQTHAAGIVFCRGGSTVAGLIYSVSNAISGNYDLGYNWNNDSVNSGWDSGISAPLNQWSLVALTVTATNATIYVLNTNGLSSATHVHGHAIQKFDAAARIGDDSSDNPTYRNFNGSIDDVALFSQTLSRNQLVGLFGASSGGSFLPPSIVTSPASKSVNQGQTTNFLVTVSGSATLTYQWQAGIVGSGIYTNLVNVGNVSGVNTTNLTISSAQFYNGADYVVVVTNLYGSITSSPAATLTVTPIGPIVITNQISGASMTLFWPYGTLQSATNVLGPWKSLTGSNSPSTITIVPTVPQMYYRVTN